LQFKYIPAHCRLYYKISNVYDMSNLWHDVVKANWIDQSLCVPGSTGIADNSIEPPPLTNVTVIPPLVNWAVNDTDLAAVISDSGGIQDTSSRLEGITPCSDTCSCQEISIRCSKPGSTPKTVSACLPSCILRTGPNSCPARTSCDPSKVVPLESKFNSLEKKGVALSSTGHKQEVHGVCRPKSTFIQSPGLFGCSN
jgi:hypothetical protein